MSAKFSYKKSSYLSGRARTELCNDAIAAKFERTFHDEFSIRSDRRSFKFICGGFIFWVSPEILAASKKFRDMLDNSGKDFTEFHDTETDPFVAWHIFNILCDFEHRMELPAELTKESTEWKVDYENYLVSLLKTLQSWDCCAYLQTKILDILCKKMPVTIELVDTVCAFSESNLESKSLNAMCDQYLGYQDRNIFRLAIEGATKSLQRDVFWRCCMERTLVGGCRFSRKKIEDSFVNFLVETRFLDDFYQRHKKHIDKTCICDEGQCDCFDMVI